MEFSIYRQILRKIFDHLSCSGLTTDHCRFNTSLDMISKRWKFILALLIMMSIINAYGQTFTFTTKISTLEDEMPICCLELNNGDIVVSARQGLWPPSNGTYSLLLIKLTSEGDTIKTSIISGSGGNCYINTLILDSANQLFGIGSITINQNETCIWLIKLDKDLNPLWEKRYNIGCVYLGYIQGLINSDQDLIIYGDGYKEPTNDYDLFTLKTTLDGDSLSFNIYPDPGTESSWAMTELGASKLYYFLISGKYVLNTNSWGQILQLDESLHITSIDMIPGNLFLYYNIISDYNNLLLTGIKVIAQPPHSLNMLGIERIDTSYMIIHADTVGAMNPDSLSYPAYFKNIDTTQNNFIYYGGTFNQDNNYYFSLLDSWLELIKYDTLLNMQWQKFYGGNMYYGLWGIKATSDGGCLLLGSTFNDQLQYNERDIIIIKVDSNGIVTGDHGHQEIQSHDAIVYPNPGTDYLIIESGPQISGATFTMTDMQGKSVFHTTLNQRSVRLSTNNQSPGVYLWSITYGNKIVETGKWVKENN